MPPKKANTKITIGESKTISPISTILPGDDRIVTAVKRIYDVGQDPSIFKTFGVRVPTFEENKPKWGGRKSRKSRKQKKSKKSKKSRKSRRNKK